MRNDRPDFVWELAYGRKTSFCLQHFNVLKKGNSLFAMNVKRSSAQRENRTKAEKDRAKKGVCVWLSFRCSFRHNKNRTSTLDCSCLVTLPKPPSGVHLRTGQNGLGWIIRTRELAVRGDLHHRP
jgi:hypothetical protein